MSVNDITRVWWQPTVTKIFGSLFLVPSGFGINMLFYLHFSHFTLGFFNLFSVPWSVIHRFESSSWNCDILWGLVEKSAKWSCRQAANIWSKRKTRVLLSCPAKFLNFSGEKNTAGFSRSPFRVNVKGKKCLALNETTSTTSWKLNLTCQKDS